MPEGEPQYEWGIDPSEYYPELGAGTPPTDIDQPQAGWGIDPSEYMADLGHGYVPPVQDVPFKEKDVMKYVLSGDIQQENLLSNMMADRAFDDDIARSVYESMKLAPNSEELISNLKESVRKKNTFLENLKYATKRIGSVAPFMGHVFDWQQHVPTPVEQQLTKDREYAGDLYDPISAFHAPILGSAKIGIGDVADLATTIGEFFLIGKATIKPFEWALKTTKASKPFAGTVKLFGATQRRKNIVKRVLKSNVDFQIHNLTSLHPEDRAEGATLKSKVMARVKRIPATAISASLFGALGGFENTFAQYGGVFTAGYSTTFLDHVLEQSKRGEADLGKAHKEAMKSGFMLAGAHFVNVLGPKGIDKFKEWGKEKGLSDESVNDIARSFVVDKMANEKERWRSKGIGPDKRRREVTIEGEKDVKGKPSYILKDAETEKTHTMIKSRFHDHFLRSASPSEKSQVRNRKLTWVKTLQGILGFDKAGHQEQNLKQEVFEIEKDKRLETREWRITQEKLDPNKRVGDKNIRDWENDFENDRVSIEDASYKDWYALSKELGTKPEGRTKQAVFDSIKDHWAPKRIRFYQQVDKLSMTDLKKILDRNGIAYPERVNKNQLMKLVKDNVEIEPGKRISWKDATTEQLDNAITMLRTEAEVKTVLTDIKTGVYQGDAKSLGAKMFDDPTRALRSVDRIIEQHEGDKILASYGAGKLVEKAEELLKENGITDEQQRKIILAAANRDGKLKNHPTPQDLTDKEYKVYEFYTETLEELGINAMREGTINDMIENYFVGLYAKQVPSAVSSTWNNIKRKLFGSKAEDIDMFKAETIGQKPGLTQRSKFSLQKLINTPLQVEGTNLKPNYNIKDHLGEWYVSTHRAMAGRKMAERLVDLPLANGKLSISATQIPGYKKLTNRSLYQALTGKSREQSVWVHPDIAKSLEIIFDANKPSAEIGAIRNVENFIKRFIMINPLIHGWNIYSDLMNENNFRLIHSAKIVFKGETPKTVVRKVKGLTRKEVSKFSKQEIAETYDRILDEMAGEGVPIAEMVQITSEFSNKANLHFSELGLTFWEKANKAMHKQGFGAKVKGLGRATRQWSDDFLWGKIVKNSMISVYSIQKGKALKRGLSEEESRQAASHYTKDLLGMLPKHVFSNRGLLSGESLNHLFFARNWTISNLRLVSGAMGYKAGKNQLRLLQHKGLNNRQVAHLQGEYAKHLIKGVVGLVVSNNILNWIMTATTEVDEAGKFKEFKLDPSKGRFAFENPPEKYLDAYTGLKDNKGLDIYLVNPLFRYIGDYFHWYGDPAKTLFNKMHPVPKQAMEQLANQSFWSGRQIVEHKDQKSYMNKFMDRFTHAIYGLTPLGQFADQPHQLRPRLERLLPFLGTWVRHGVAGDTGAYQAGSKMNEFMKIKKYEKDEVDKIIDEMDITGNPADVMIEYMLKNRYKDLDDVQRRMVKYRTPNLYRWLTFFKSKIKRQEFLNEFLTPWQRKQHLDKLRAEAKSIAELIRKERREKKANP